MQVMRCPNCRGPLEIVETKNLFTKHAGCTGCRRLYVMWGNTLSLCQTPTRCAPWPWTSVLTGKIMVGAHRPEGNAGGESRTPKDARRDSGYTRPSQSQRRFFL